MKADVENITPAKARAMLAGNSMNRSLSERRTKRFAEEIKRGAWLDNGASIVMNGRTLLDGQHRLSAIVESGVAVDMVVVRDVDPDAFTSIDTGESRRLKDVLKIKGEVNDGALAAAINVHRSYAETGFVRSNRRWTFAEQVEYLRCNPGIGISTEFVCGLKGKHWVGKGTLSGLHALLSSKSRIEANEFVRKLVTGEGLTSDDPVSWIRDRFIKDQTAGIGQMNVVQRATYILLTWNSARKGQSKSREQVNRRDGKGVRKVEIV